MAGPEYYTAADGVRFLIRKTSARQIFDVPEYRFSDIGINDRVIDIGANVGAFCIRAARLSGQVMAVEPVMAPILSDNCRLNRSEVCILAAGLGDGTPALCTWDDQSAVVPTYPLGTLISMAGGCDFLKCDCEGAEWQIRPCDLAGIRRIEMELHIPPISGPPDMALLDYISNHYDFSIDRKPCHDVLGVMGVLHAKRR